MVYTGGSSDSIFIADHFQIDDTKTHTYRTDPDSIGILGIGDQRPPLKAFSIWLYNATNQVLTSTVIGNITGDGTYPDYTMPIGTGTSVTVQPGDTQLIVYEFSRYATEYISLEFAFSTAPTKGYITAKLMTYQ